jgi:hypothetical protein
VRLNSHSYCPLICIFDLFIDQHIFITLEKKSSAAAMELPLRSSTSVALKAQGDETTSIYILISYCNCTYYLQNQNENRK